MTVAGVANAGPAICSRDVVIVPDNSLEDVAKVNPVISLNFLWY